jgi:hypothetical protein
VKCHCCFFWAIENIESNAVHLIGIWQLALTAEPGGGGGVEAVHLSRQVNLEYFLQNKSD